MFFGQLQYIYLLHVPPTPDLGIVTATYIALAVINECKSPVRHPSNLDIFTYSDMRGIEVVDIATVEGLVGRIWWKNKWAIFDRGGVSARPTFARDEDDDDYED